ncbi:uncharacterized protein LOC126845971 [Adelges cooleyi]|uniref:uncharacterized protein LOC126845971 n=1 Tax=Adelges cooleyi TaxID=133065 RepID=UPI00217F5584|nr:uncharacterized protein LOC126845971 [Adelges cooleyi]
MKIISLQLPFVLQTELKMKFATVVLALAACFAFSLAETTPSTTDVKYFVDNATLPERLPELMRGKFSDEDIEKAVIQAFVNQYEVVSEYNGHVYDPAFPYGYLKDDVRVPKTRASGPLSDLIFEGNTVKGLSNYLNSSLVIRWYQDQIYQEVNWNELQIKGQYQYLTPDKYDKGKYAISVNGVKYQVISPLSSNTELYPVSAPKSAISYEGVRASFTGPEGFKDVFNVNDSPNVKYFLEDVVFQKIANQVLQDMQSNITSAIRYAAKPYINFKNHSDPHFPAASGQLKNGPIFNISKAFTSGLNNTLQKLKSLKVNMDSNSVTVQTTVSVHKLFGTFNLVVDEPQKHESEAQFNFENMELISNYDLVRPDQHCETRVEIYNKSVTSSYQLGNSELNAQANQQFADAFADEIISHISTGFCKFIVKYTTTVPAQ